MPEFLSGPSNILIPSKLSFGFSKAISYQLVNPGSDSSSQPVNPGDVHLREIIKLLISDPKFKELVKAKMKILMKFIEIEIVYFFSHHMKLTGLDFRT